MQRSMQNVWHQESKEWERPTLLWGGATVQADPTVVWHTMHQAASPLLGSTDLQPLVTDEEQQVTCGSSTLKSGGPVQERTDVLGIEMTCSLGGKMPRVT